jgi:ornithine decarboxylase
MNTISENEEIINNGTFSFLPNFIKDHSVTIIDKKNPIQSDLIQVIIEKYGPSGAFYIVNIGDILRRLQLWRKLFPTIEPFYAVKSNCSSVICELLGLCGIGFDVASIGEINIIKDKVKNMNKIIFAHPIKPIDSIVYARTVDVDLLVVDSEHELYKVKLYHPHANLLIRLKVDDKDSICRFSEKFGIDQDNITNILDLASRMNLNVKGVSFHVGSNCKNAKQYYSAIEMAKYTFDIAKEKNFNFSIIDSGGGFSGDNSNESFELLENISTEIYKALEDFFNNDPNLTLMAEPGRFFCTNSHTLVLNVIGKKVKIDKETGNKIQTLYLNDGLYGSFSAITYDYQKPTIIPYNNDDIQKYKTILQGASCDSLDVVCKDIMLPELEISDLVYVENFGAYTISSSSSFNGFSVKDFYYVYDGL